MELRLEQLTLYKEIMRRRDQPEAIALGGLLQFAVGDTARILEFVRASCPGFTDHSVQHSLRIIKRIGSILRQEAIESLSTVEIFSLILAALFHDTGMTSFDDAPGATARLTHHLRSGAVFDKYLQERIGVLSEHHGRLSSCIQFAIASHGLSWDEMVSRNEFIRPNMVMDNVVRCNVIAILLRVGDLLDLDVNRTCDVLRSHFPTIFSEPIAKIHHDRHSRVSQFFYDSERIEVAVNPLTRDEHQIWHDWLQWLEQDIIRSNTYVFDGALAAFRLPRPKLSIVPAPDARYEVWPLRFEIDDSGRLWDVLSKSVYTGRFDFIRELIQNAIDAEMAAIYWSADGETPTSSPRSWSKPGYYPRILVVYSEKNRRLQISDNGIGMNRHALESYLFRVAESGYNKQKTDRPFPFPSIATFGVGFISVLLRASKVTLTTKPWASQSGDEARRVTITNGGRDAYVERTTARQGTSIQLDLIERFSAIEIGEYILSHVRYPASAVSYIDLDRMDASTIGGQDCLQLAEQMLSIDVKGASSGRIEHDDIGLTYHRLIEHWKTTAPPDRHVPMSFIEIRAVSPSPLFSKLAHIEITRRLRPVRAGYGPLRRLKNNIGLLFVPVSFMDLDMGIEWNSVHVLFVHEGWAVRECLLDTDDSECHLYVDGDDVYVDSERNSHHSRRSNSNYLLDGLIAAPRAGMLSIDDVLSIIGDFRDLGSEVFQDGIVIPVAPWWIAPIGACRGQVNLTAGARMRLNITRGSIDETPALLRDWVARVAGPVQQRVVDCIAAALKGSHVAFDARKLWPSEDDDAPKLLSYAAMEARTRLNSAGALAR